VRQRGEADSSHKEQMVIWMDEGVVLLQGAHTCVCARGEAMYHLHSHLCGLDFWMEPPFDCADDDLGNTAFVQATKFIGGWDAMEEFVACGIHLLAAGVSFKK
jgi:hypothetical protein